MNITINGSLVNKSIEHINNLEEILINLSDTSIPPNHLVGSVMINGNEFSEVFPGQAKEIAAVNINDLDIETVSLEKFAEAAIKDSAFFVKNIIMAVNKTAELFRIYDETEANEKMAQIIDPLRALVVFINSTRIDLKWDFENDQIDGHPIVKDWEKLHSVIDELKLTQEEGDWILYADLLEYELVPVLNVWVNIFEEKSKNFNA
jgi:cell fate (sporulation/competence/biofilm development) regulator YmcA (YheA/YmcA/DUF963 family)